MLLLNLGPTHRGTIAAIQQRILEGIGDWLAVNGEAIYSTVALPKGSRAEDLVEMSTFMPTQVGWNNVFGVKPGTPEKGHLVPRQGMTLTSRSRLLAYRVRVQGAVYILCVFVFVCACVHVCGFAFECIR